MRGGSISTTSRASSCAPIFGRSTNCTPTSCAESGCSSSKAVPKQIITAPDAPTTGFTDKSTPSPLAQAIRTGNLLFVSGQGPLDPKTREVVSPEIREQTRQTLANLRAILQAAGLTFANVVNMRVVLRNTEDFAAFRSEERRVGKACRSRESASH